MAWNCSCPGGTLRVGLHLNFKGTGRVVPHPPGTRGPFVPAGRSAAVRSRKLITAITDSKSCGSKGHAGPAAGHEMTLTTSFFPRHSMYVCHRTAAPLTPQTTPTDRQSYGSPMGRVWVPFMFSVLPVRAGFFPSPPTSPLALEPVYLNLPPGVTRPSGGVYSPIQ